MRGDLIIKVKCYIECSLFAEWNPYILDQFLEHVSSYIPAPSQICHMMHLEYCSIRSDAFESGTQNQSINRHFGKNIFPTIGSFIW